MSSTESEETPKAAESTTSQAVAPQKSTSTGEIARKAEHRYLTALAIYAGNTSSLEITRPTITNCPDGGHDLNVRGTTDEVKDLVSNLTQTPFEELSFLDGSAVDGNLKVRIDVKSGKTISGDTIDNHVSNSTRSPDCQVNLLALTNPNYQITKEAHKKLDVQKPLFQEIGTLIGIAPLEGLERIEDINKSQEATTNSDESAPGGNKTL